MSEVVVRSGNSVNLAVDMAIVIVVVVVLARPSL